MRVGWVRGVILRKEMRRFEAGGGVGAAFFFVVGGEGDGKEG